MATSRWNIDPAHSSIGFTVRHMVITKVRGAFTRFAGSFELDADDPTKSSVTAAIETASVDTHEAKRDEHLRSADFFAAAEHPQLTFRSTRVEPIGKGELRITGELTLRGVTKEVTLTAENLGGGKDPWGNERVGFSAATRINRKDFGLTWNQALEAGGILVGEDVDITLDIQGIRA